MVALSQISKTFFTRSRDNGSACTAVSCPRTSWRSRLAVLQMCLTCLARRSRSPREQAECLLYGRSLPTTGARQARGSLRQSFKQASTAPVLPGLRRSSSGVQVQHCRQQRLSVMLQGSSNPGNLVYQCSIELPSAGASEL